MDDSAAAVSENDKKSRPSVLPRMHLQRGGDEKSFPSIRRSESFDGLID